MGKPETYLTSGTGCLKIMVNVYNIVLQLLFLNYKDAEKKQKKIKFNFTEK